MPAGPLVAIIICNYNYARYLDQSISSAVGQTYEHLEVIVVDDGSTDHSQEVIRRYQGRVRSVLKPNGGQGSAINAGFALSRGEIVLFLDADDFLRSDAVAKVVDGWRPDVAKVQFCLEVVDAVGRSLGRSVPPVPCPPGGALRLLCRYGYYPSPPCSGNAYARSVLRQILPLGEKEWTTHADSLPMDLSPLMGEIVHLPEVLGSYRVHGANLSELGQVSLAKIRQLLAIDRHRERAIREWSNREGRSVPPALFMRNPNHCKKRLISLRIDPAGHEFPRDGIPYLVAAGVIDAFRFPHLSLRKRLLTVAGFLALGVLPSSVVARNLDALMHPDARFLTIRRLSQLMSGSTLEHADKPAHQGSAK
jgi:glycosyltransferase involved in cell wall biosynthesis